MRFSSASQNSAVNNMKEDTKPEPETESDVSNFGSEKDVMIRLVQELESAQLIKLAGSHAKKELVAETV